MIELYHHGSSVCAAKVRLCLEEKQIKWKGHYLDILAGEQFTESYLKINPKGVVPTLVEGNLIITESTIICEYLEDIKKRRRLRPAIPEYHVRQLYWTKAVDEELHPACGELTFAASHRFTVLNLGEQKVKAFLDSTPEKSVTADWHNRKKEIVQLGFKAPGIDKKVQLYDSYLKKMERDLKTSKWLAGNLFSLADCAMVPYLMRLDMLCFSKMWTDNRLPRVEAWLEECKQRPSFEPAIWAWLPDALKADLHNNGQKSWLEVAPILGIG